MGGVLLAAMAEGAGAAVTPGGRVSSADVPARPVFDEAPSVVDGGAEAEADRDVEDGADCELDPSASAAGTSDAAEGDQT